ncbi:hypothetical protein LR48_Vigan08g027600 [Vigna angularis]|uniref:Legume lectin domain-containing protein n=1 Tax=Phaseolus angularis TaxID=3914 RepID=A0A0L9V440_PHAAN|nr:hypothetical protein LR48_Vigan08g027600 [Vigna angularis]
MQSPNLDPDNIDLFDDAHSPSCPRGPCVDATTTLSTEFSLSIFGNGDDVLFVLTGASANGSDTVAVEFVTSKDENVGDPNSSHVGIDVGSHLSLAVVNASYVGLVLNNGEKLNAWVHYEGGPKVMQVRLSKRGEQKPYDREEEEEDGEGNGDDDEHVSDISPGREDGHEQSVVHTQNQKAHVWSNGILLVSLKVRPVWANGIMQSFEE